MPITAFDTLKLAHRLEAAGMAGQQAEAVAEALAETMVADPATRTDLLKSEQALRTEFHGLRSEFQALRAEFQALRADLAKSDQALRAELLKTDLSLRGELHKLRGEMVAGFATVKFDILRWMVPLFLAQMSLTLGLFVRLAG